MSRSFKIIGITLLSLFVFSFFVRICTQVYIDNSFEYQVKKANESFPIELKGIGEVKSVELKDGYLIYNIWYKEEYFNKDIFIQYPEKAKEMLVMSFFLINAQGYNIGSLGLDYLIKEGYGLCFKAVTSTIDNFEIKADVEYLRNVKRRYNLNPQEAFYNVILLQLEMEKSTLPMKVDEGFTIIDYLLEDENIIIVTDVKESVYSMDNIEGVSEYLKKILFDEALNDPNSFPLFALCKVSHTGIVYRFVGNYSEQIVEVLISSEEIRRRVITPTNANVN